jgi:uncharacterized protein YcaQ
MFGPSDRGDSRLANTNRRVTTTSQASNPQPEPITYEEARLLSLAAQRLDVVEHPASPPDKTAIVEMVRALGCVQLDSISVVSRSHETVLWSRLGHYDVNLWNELYFPDGLVNEYWAHAAAIIPVEMLHHFRRRMATYKDPTSDLHAAWQPEPEVNRIVLEAIRERGPLPSRAFERPDGLRAAAWSWWGGKPANKALDFLWTCGDLTIHRRDGFQRVYELTERRFPEFHRRPLPAEDEQQRFFVSRALSAMGVATPRMERDDSAIRVALPGTMEPAWIDPALLPLLAAIRAGSVAAARTTLLSPFDSLVWHRERALTLFGFDYRLESYTPAPKRRYGYYTLPILHQGRLVGRLDPSYDRKRRLLTIKSVHLEPDVAVSEDLVAELASTLIAFCVFLGGAAVHIVESVPPGLTPPLKRTLDG